MDISFSILEWDSQQFGFPCGLLTISPKGKEIHLKELYNKINQVLTSNKTIRFITIKVPVQYSQITNLLIKDSANFIDTEIVFSNSNNKNSSLSYMQSTKKKVQFVDNIKPEPFISIAKDFKYSRFFLDDKIDNSVAIKIWENSIYNYCKGRADKIAVIYEKNKPAGFATLNYMTKNKIDLFMVAIRKGYRGKGFGKQLISGILEAYEGNNFYVGTQSINDSAQRLYQSTGFTIDYMQYILHVWQ